MLIPMAVPSEKHTNLIYIDRPILEHAKSVLGKHGGLEKAIGLYGICQNEKSGPGADGYAYFTAIRLYLTAEDCLSFVFPQTSLKEFLENGQIQIPNTRRFGIRFTGIEYDEKQVHKKKGIRNNPENRDIVGEFINDYYGRKLGVDFIPGSPSRIARIDVLAGNFY